ncbi:MAG: Tim44/TimA family putative adaptor protein [Paracoccaceae bacterium]
MNAIAIEILVLAGIAIFLIMRLKSVLGTREGFEKPRAQSPATLRSPDLKVIEGGPDADITDHVPAGSELAQTFTSIKAVDSGFLVSEFLSGSRAAYEMILMGFERGDLSAVRSFLSDEVIAQRSSQGLQIEAEFLGIREMKINDVIFDKATDMAEITVSFISELISVVKNSDGEIIEGDEKQSKRQKDVWTFSKDLTSQDPVWFLVATGE